MKKTVATLLVAACLPSWAASLGAAATFDTLSYRLIDLRPKDGIAPSVTFHDSPSTVLLESKIFGDHANNVEGGSSFWSAFSSAYKSTGASAATSVASLSGGPSFMMLASGSALTGRGGFDAFNSYVGMALDMELGAYTAIQWTGRYSISSWALRSAAATTTDQSFAYVTFGGLDNEFMVSAASLPGGDPHFASKTGAATFRLSNDTGAGALETAYFRAVASAGQTVAPVPEPSSWALMLAGAVVVGGVARRRLQQPHLPGEAAL